MCHDPICCIVPDHVLRRIAERGNDDERRAALDTLAASVTMRSARIPAEARRSASPRAPEAGIMALEPPRKQRIIRDARRQQDLRGPIVRQEGGGDVADPAVNEAYEDLGGTWDFYFEVFARNSIDKAGLPLEGIVHYRDGYDNAVWNGSQMVFGDGSGFRFTRLTQSLTVCAHELTHGVIQYDGPLVYQREAGALNESLADVFGTLVEQYKLKQTPDKAVWLIGREFLAKDVQGVELRSLKHTGTAYDDDVLGAD